MRTYAEREWVKGIWNVNKASDKVGGVHLLESKFSIDKLWSRFIKFCFLVNFYFLYLIILVNEDLIDVFFEI